MRIEEKTLPLKNLEIDAKDFVKFRKYLNDFYGRKGVYPNKYGKDLEARDVLKAIDTVAGKNPKHRWDWDSLDRELVRDELIKMKKFDYPTQESAIKEISEVGKMFEDETKDPQEIQVGNYQTKFFDMCPGASQLYKDIESKGVDVDMAERSVKLQDALFAIEKHILQDWDWDKVEKGEEESSQEKYRAIAQNLGDQIMAMAEMMNLVDEHSYIQGHLETIEKALNGDEEVEPTKDTFEEGKKFKQVKKDKYGNHLEPQFKKGDKVTYLGNKGVITGVNKEMGGVYSYNVAYDKGNGRTKASNISNKNGNELKESVMEGKKRFKRQDGIGKAKYTISYHDGKKKHKDGSDFFDIKIFKNKKDLSDFVGTLVKQGYKLTNESINEADVVGKTIFSDGKGKLFFGYYKTDDAVEFVDYKTWKKLNFKDVSKGDTNKERVIKAIVKKQKQFNKKVDYNMWSKKTNPSFEEKMDWFIKNGWIGNINKGGIREGASDINKAPIPSAIKIKLEKALDVLDGKKLTYPQKLQVLGKVLDSMNIDRGELTKVTQKLKNKLESVNEESFTATNKETGNVSVFKSKEARDAAIKAGTHSKGEDKGGEKKKGFVSNLFGKIAKSSKDKADAEANDQPSDPKYRDIVMVMFTTPDGTKLDKEFKGREEAQAWLDANKEKYPDAKLMRYNKNYKRVPLE